MRFTVPQFTEYETKLVGSLSFRQSLFVGAAGVICIVLYFLIGEASISVFLILSMIILGAGVSLAFLKISGRDLPTVLVNFLHFSLASKFYIWKKKEAKITFSKNLELKKELKKGEVPLKTTQAGLLKKIRNEIEVKTR